MTLAAEEAGEDDARRAVVEASKANAAGAGLTMTAVVQDEYGSDPEGVLRVAVVARPTIADDEVLVRVRAASVDRGTWHVMSGLPYPIRVAGFGLRRPKGLNPGRAVASVVEAVGSDVTEFEAGDEVFGVCEGGAFAEYAAARSKKVAAPQARARHTAAVGRAARGS